MRGVGVDVDFAVVGIERVGVGVRRDAGADRAGRLAQAAIPFATGGQAWLQPPQCRTLLDVFISQPSLKTRLQLAYGTLQAPTAHIELAQTVVPCGTDGQTVPQAPQWSTLLGCWSRSRWSRCRRSCPSRRCTRRWRTSSRADGVASRSADGAAATAVVALVVVLVSQPLPTFPSQFAKPALQLPMAQTEARAAGGRVASTGTSRRRPRVVDAGRGVGLAAVADVAVAVAPAGPARGVPPSRPRRRGGR